MNFILIGGAPLSQTTHDFIRVCLGSIVVQGYSLTESTCTGTVMENCDLTSNTVGAPMTGKILQSPLHKDVTYGLILLL